jgi:hypothetical protein
VRTDFVIFEVAQRARFLEGLAREGILMAGYPGGTVRAVTHLGIQGPHVERVVAVVARLLAATPAASTIS